MTRDFLLILTVLSRGPAKFRVATTVYPLLPKHPCRSVPSTFEKHGISPSGIEWRPPHPARRPPRRPSQASSPSLFPSDEQINRWSPVGASSAPEPTDAFPSLQLHKGGSPTVSIPLRILDLVGFMGPSLLPISGWTRMAAGSRGCQWGPLTPCQPRHWRIGARHRPVSPSDSACHLPPGYVRTPEQRCPRAVDTIRHAAASS